MTRTSMAVACGCVLLGMARGVAACGEEPPAAETPVTSHSNPEVLKIHLMDGSQIGGKLAAAEIEVETSYGKLTIPVTAIVSLTPGLASHPQVGQSLDQLIEKLGSPAFAEREGAQKALVAMGPSMRLRLARAADDADNERRSRVRAILEEFDQIEADEEQSEAVGTTRLIDRDTIETLDFTLVGKIVQQEFEIASHYGVLKVKLSDIRRIEREAAEKQDLQKTVTVDGGNLVTRTMKDSGLRIERGDKITIAADGTITMTPWGNQAMSTPDGAPNYGWYQPNKIAGGALIGRIGPQGNFFRIGSKHSFTADRTGMLQLAVAVQGDPQNQQFPGEYRVKVRVKRK